MKQKFTFGFIGTFAYWHGIEVIETLILSFEKSKESPHFLLVGDGVLLPKLKENLKKAGVNKASVTFTGSVPQDQAPDYLAKCDAFLCPTQPNKDGSRFFGSPTKLFEYMSMAKPIIASDLEQLTEVISPAIRVTGTQTTVPLVVNDEVGILVEPLDKQGFFNACRFCFHLPQALRQKMGNNARTKVLQDYTWQKHVEKIVVHAKL